MAGGSSSKKSSSHGAWLGNEIYEGHIEALCHHRLLPPPSQVLVQIPGAETAPTPTIGEVVVFNKHFYRGFGLPASSFFSEWLHFFGLQPHHLALNAILQLSAFVVLCEGFLGIEPRLDLWWSLFFFKQQSIAMEKAELEKLVGPCPMTPCGAALVHHRSKSGFPQLPLQESIKQWQKGFFYVKNADPAQDALNMPPFNINPPTKLNWATKSPKPIPEVAQIGAHLKILEKGGLLGRDLLTTMATADAAQRELEEQSKRRWDAIAGKTTEGQSRPIRAEKPVEKRTKAIHDPFEHARVEEPASEAALRRAPRAEETQPSESGASAPVDLEVIPNSPRAEAAPDAPDLILDAPDVAPDAPGVTMDAPDAAHPPPVEEAAPARTSAEPAAAPVPGAGAIVIPHHGPAAPGAGAWAGSRPMKSWRAANLARARLPVGTALHAVPELVPLFANRRFKVDQADRVVGSDLERLEERTRDLYDAQVQAYNELRAQSQAADGQVAELQVRLGEVIVERDALRDAGGRLQEQLALLQTEKKELKVASRVELEQLRASL
ncbi:hypothetical protein D1007_25663 [Hordeum vulgare]|nr:hypothetical protein D1007_25663 [Hordeum vulgare]